MNTLLINISKTQNSFLEKKAVECGCTREEFIDLLITRTMESDCKYYECGFCVVSGEKCGTVCTKEWLNGSVCEVYIDYEGDLKTLDCVKG